MPGSKLIPLTKLVEPAHAARTEMSDALLDSLEESIREMGVLEPLLVTPAENGNFEVLAGHRRLIACRRAGLASVPCIVEASAERAAAIKIQENVEREDLSAVDEAIFYAELYEKHGDDVDQVAMLVKKTRAHVERRLLLLRGDEDVRESLRKGEISLGVAEELNKMIRAEDRQYHLAFARRTGCSISTAKTWRMEANARAELRAAAGEPEPSTAVDGDLGPTAAGAVPAYISRTGPGELTSSQEPRPCMFCQDTHPEWRMFRKFMCQPCADNVWPEFEKHYRHD